jgi:hypothetical protein
MGKGRAGNHERGGTPKKVDVSHAPGLGSGAAPLVSTEPSPAVRRYLRPACQHNSGAWKKLPLAVVTRPCGAGLQPPAVGSLQQLSSCLHQAPQPRCLSVPRPCPGVPRQRPAGGIQGGPAAGAGRLGPALARRAPRCAARGVRAGPARGA